ncbi:MAG: hypothetical protein PHH26_00585 [Candidatus Thermoplasmatota archaeon]|nr:hypothetical protein [Candidatus Thermoplasmatota archaeon]
MQTAVKTKRVKPPETAIRPVQVTAIAEASAIERVYKEAEIVCEELTALKIVDFNSSDHANILIGRVKAGRKAVDELRKKILDEPKRFTDTVNAMFKPILAMCDDVITAKNRERDAFRDAEAAKIRAAEEKAAREAIRRQNISVSKGGDGSSIKPVEKPVDMLKVRSTDTVRRIPDKDKIQAAVDKAVEKIKVECPLNIPGVLVSLEWNIQIVDATLVPDEYRKNSYVD